MITQADKVRGWFFFGQCKIEDGLRTADHGLGVKHGQGIKCGLRTILAKTVLTGST